MPELQGPPEEVAIEKCKLAAAQVRNKSANKFIFAFAVLSVIPMCSNQENCSL